MVITKEIEVSDEVLAKGGFADIRSGMYMGHLVAVKTMRVAEEDGFAKIRKVCINDIFSALGTRSQPLIPSSNFARKSFSGARYLTRTS